LENKKPVHIFCVDDNDVFTEALLPEVHASATIEVNGQTFYRQIFDYDNADYIIYTNQELNQAEYLVLEEKLHTFVSVPNE